MDDLTGVIANLERFDGDLKRKPVKVLVWLGIGVLFGGGVTYWWGLGQADAHRARIELLGEKITGLEGGAKKAELGLHKEREKNTLLTRAEAKLREQNGAVSEELQKGKKQINDLRNERRRLEEESAALKTRIGSLEADIWTSKDRNQKQARRIAELEGIERLKLFIDPINGKEVKSNEHMQSTTMRHGDSIRFLDGDVVVSLLSTTSGRYAAIANLKVNVLNRRVIPVTANDYLDLRVREKQYVLRIDSVHRYFEKDVLTGGSASVSLLDPTRKP